LAALSEILGFNPISVGASLPPSPALASAATAAQIMSTSISTTSPDTPLEDAAAIMRDQLGKPAVECGIADEPDHPVQEKILHIRVKL